MIMKLKTTGFYQIKHSKNITGKGKHYNDYHNKNAINHRWYYPAHIRHRHSISTKHGIASHWRNAGNDGHSIGWPIVTINQ